MNKQETFKHLTNLHQIDRGKLLSDLYDASFDIDALHTQYHDTESGHNHETDGSVTPETKTVMNGKVIKRTEGGWSLESTAAEALQDFNSIVNNHPVEFRFVNEGAHISGFIYHESGVHFSVEGANFLIVVKLLLGEIYNYMDQQTP